MKIELCCRNCFCRFSAPPETASMEVLDRMFDDGPAYALGDGETFEDMIFTSLIEHGQIHCPECGEAVHVSEESLSQLALTMLSRI
jgi:hypothetical protein